MTDNIIQFTTREERAAELDDRELMLDLMRGFKGDYEREEAAREARLADGARAFVDRVRSLGIARRVSDRQFRQLWEVAATL